MNDPLTQAIIDAGEELHEEYGWLVRLEGSVGGPQPNNEFVEVLHKHVEPLINSESQRRARIKALRAELAELKSDLEDE